MTNEQHTDRNRWRLALLLLPLLAAMVWGEETTAVEYIPIPQVLQQERALIIQQAQTALEHLRLRACMSARLTVEECGQWDASGRIPNLKPKEAKEAK